jgi:Xaa-Pro aminopeptidase
VTTAPRHDALIAALQDDVDAALVTHLVNVRYLTGFTGSNAAVLVLRSGGAQLATDGRYAEQAAAEAPDVRVVVTRSLGPRLMQLAAELGAKRVAIERHHVTLTQHDNLRAAADNIELTDLGAAVEDLRVQKDADELAALAEACAITDAAFADVLPALRPGITERDVAWRLLESMRDSGAEGAAFDSIVAFGPHSAIPHHQPTDRPLAAGDLVKMDFGARVRGYHADMTRTVVCGPPADWQRELHQQVADVQEQCRAATVPGAVPLELDLLAQRLIEKAGSRLVHGLGHGVGLEIHEQPFLVPSTTAARLVARVPVTVEPGIYLPGRGGVRIEDTVLVAPGGADPLTTSTRELVET